MDCGSVFEAELRIPWDSLGCCFLESTRNLNAGHRCSISVASVTRQGRQLRHLVEVRGEEARKVAGCLAIRAARTSGPRPASKAYCLEVVETPVCPLYEVLCRSSCFLVKETAESNCLAWEVMAESAREVDSLIRSLRRGGVRARVQRIAKVKAARGLTARQEEVLRLAYCRGFFESPHRTSVRELAEAFGRSPSTFIRHLRTAESKVFGEKFRFEQTGPRWEWTVDTLNKN